MNELTVGRLLSETWHAARRGFGPFATTLLGFVFLVLFAVLQAVASVVTYHELRRVKEGIGSDELAAAFD